MPIIFVILAACALGLSAQEIAHSEQIKGYKARDDEKRVEITRLEACIKALMLERNDFITKFGALDETAARQDAFIRIMQRLLAEKDDTIRILQRRLAEKDDTIRILQRRLAEKQAELA